MTRTVSDRELYFCGECRVWDPDHQPSVQAALEKDPHCYDNERIVWVRTGQSMYGHELHVELVLCKRHKEMA